MRSGSNPYGFASRYLNLNYQPDYYAKTRAKEEAYGSQPITGEEEKEETKPPQLQPQPPSPLPNAAAMAGTYAATQGAINAAAAPSTPVVIPTGSVGPAGFRGTSLTSAGPASAAVYGAVAGGRGLYEARQTYQQGHGQQQLGLMQAGNPVLTGTNAIAGNPLDTKTAGRIGLSMNPHPAAQALLFADHLGINPFSGKDEGQRRRDSMRTNLQQMGISSTDTKWPGISWQGHGIQLSDGTFFNVGAEQTPLGNRIYETPNVPFAGEVVGLANPFGIIAANGDRDLGSQYATMFTNAIVGNARTYSDARSNMLAIANRFGGPDDVLAKLQEFLDKGLITQAEYNAYEMAIESMVRGNAPQYQDSMFAERVINSARTQPRKPMFREG